MGVSAVTYQTTDPNKWSVTRVKPRKEGAAGECAEGSPAVVGDQWVKHPQQKHMKPDLVERLLGGYKDTKFVDDATKTLLNWSAMATGLEALGSVAGGIGQAVKLAAAPIAVLNVVKAGENGFSMVRAWSKGEVSANFAKNFAKHGLKGAAQGMEAVAAAAYLGLVEVSKAVLLPLSIAKDVVSLVGLSLSTAVQIMDITDLSGRITDAKGKNVSIRCVEDYKEEAPEKTDLKAYKELETDLQADRFNKWLAVAECVGAIALTVLSLAMALVGIYVAPLVFLIGGSVLLLLDFVGKVLSNRLNQNMSDHIDTHLSHYGLQFERA